LENVEAILKWKNNSEHRIVIPIAIKELFKEYKISLLPEIGNIENIEK